MSGVSRSKMARWGRSSLGVAGTVGRSVVVGVAVPSGPVRISRTRDYVVARTCMLMIGFIVELETVYSSKQKHAIPSLAQPLLIRL